MSIATDKSSARYLGNGATREFSFDFKVWEPSQIRVTQADAEGAETDVTDACLVTVTDTGGTVTLPEPLPEGFRLAVTRAMPFVQEDRYVTGTRFDPHEIEDALDIACAERQELREKLERTLVVPVTGDATPDELMQDLLDTAERADAFAEKTERLYEEVRDLRDHAESLIVETGEQQAARVASEGEKQVARLAAEADAHIDRAAAEADRAENAADIAALTRYVSGAGAALTLAEDLPAGSVIPLPAGLRYLVGRHHLRVSYEGLVLSPTFVEEVGEAGQVSTEVRVRFALSAGQELDFWVIPLGEAGEVLEEVRAEGESLAASFAAEAKKAEEAAERASGFAAEAQAAAAVFPPQEGHEGAYLTTDGENLRWEKTPGGVSLSDAVDSSDGDVAASSCAVKTAYDEAARLDACLVDSLDDVPDSLREGGIIILRTTV